MIWYRWIYTKGLYFIECVQWHWVTSWNVGFAIMSNLFYFGFQGCWKQESNAWQYFQRKSMNKISIDRLIFHKSGTYLQLKWGKCPAKAGQNREFTALTKPLVPIGELQCDCVSTENDQSNKKSLFWTQFSHTLSWVTKGERERPPLPFFKNWKKCPDFGKKVLIGSIFRLAFPFKM